MFVESTFRNNFGRAGGGLHVSHANVSAVVTGCKFSGNKAELCGGALVGSTVCGTLMLRNSIFRRNQASLDGGAVVQAISAYRDGCVLDKELLSLAAGNDSTWDEEAAWKVIVDRRLGALQWGYEHEVDDITVHTTEQGVASDALVRDGGVIAVS